MSLESELVNMQTTDKADMTVVASSFDQTLSNHLDDSDLTDSGLEDDDNLKGKDCFYALPMIDGGIVFSCLFAHKSSGMAILFNVFCWR